MPDPIQQAPTLAALVDVAKKLAETSLAAYSKLATETATAVQEQKMTTDLATSHAAALVGRFAADASNAMMIWMKAAQLASTLPVPGNQPPGGPANPPPGGGGTGGGPVP